MEPRALLFIVVFLLILGGVFYYFNKEYKPKVIANANGPFPFDSSEILSSMNTKQFYTEGVGSFSTFINIESINRTGSYTSCGTGPGQVSCGDGSFAPCACIAATGDCTQCAHSGYTSMFNISDVAKLEILTAPDASRQGMAMSQLVIKTITKGAGGTPQVYIETLRLPPISLQKWIMVTVAREGRRFDVYYNDTIVLSQKTMYMPISDSSYTNMKGVTSGSNSLKGELALANLYSYRLSSLDVSAKYREYADTRGHPRISQEITGNYSVNLCPSGGCFDMPVIKPASPLYEWTSSYS
jgi:hypothetical protein